VRGGLGILDIPVELLEANPFQPRREFDEAALRSLADSITRSGLMQPVVVRPAGKTGAGRQKYQLVAGERRWRAAQLGGIARIPAVVRELSDEETAEWAVVENAQRADLNVMEAAFAYKSLMDKFGLTHAEIGERVGLDRTTVVNTIRLTELEESIQRLLRSKLLSAGHGKVLLSMAPGASREMCAQSASELGWSVRRLEAEARIATAAAATPLKKLTQADHDKYLARNAARLDLEKQLGQWLGTRVTIQTTGASGTNGKLMVEFFGVEQFEGVLKKMGWRGE